MPKTNVSHATLHADKQEAHFQRSNLGHLSRYGKFYLLDWFRVTSLVTLGRSSFLSFSWICIVRRHLKEVTLAKEKKAAKSGSRAVTSIAEAIARPFDTFQATPENLDDVFD